MKTWSLLLFMVLLAGCRSVGPDYQRPAPRRRQAGAKPAPATVATLDATWWRMFDDPELDALAERALAVNQSLRKSVARFDEARATLRAAVADAGPSATLAASGIRARSSENGKQPSAGPDGAGRKLTENAFRVSLDTSYELDLWGRVRRSLENAEAQLAAQARGDADRAAHAYRPRLPRPVSTYVRSTRSSPCSIARSPCAEVHWRRIVRGSPVGSGLMPT